MTDPDLRYEVRLALVMTGGVSLAVWMGGVTAEIYRLVRREEGRYRLLLDTLWADATVDVVTGASAGGLNGVFLASALARDLPVGEFDSLRDVWLSSGSLMSLLRNPRQRNPPSLLKGDEYFKVQIERVLGSWLQYGPCRFAEDEKFDLVLTATTLSAELVEHADDRGTSIVEPVHRARFCFDEDHFATADVKECKMLARQLALAARTSASFPGAFEASFVPVGAADEEVDMAGIASFTSSKWAIDGGVLVNKPIGPAMELLRERRPLRDGKRVLFYINPDPSGSGARVADSRAQAPTMATVVSKALVTLPRVESVAADLAALRERNALVRSQRSSRDDLLLRTELVGDIVQLAQRLYGLWALQRTNDAVTKRLRARFQAEGGALNLPVSASGAGARKADYTWDRLKTALCAQRVAQQWLAPDFPSSADLGEGREWRYGFDPIEYFCSVVLDLTRRANEMLPIDAPEADVAEVDETRRALGDLRTRAQIVRNGIALLRGIDSDYWRLQLDAGPDADERTNRNEGKFARRLYALWPAPPTEALRSDVPSGPAGLKVEACRRRWRTFASYLKDNDLLDAPPKPRRGEPTTQLTLEEFRLSTDQVIDLRPPDALEIAAQLRPVVRQKELRLARELADVAIELRTQAAKLARLGVVNKEPTAGPTTTAAAASNPSPVVEQLVLALVGQARTPATADVLRKMFALYVIHSLTEEIDEVEGIIEFVQISADIDSPIDAGRSSASDKVAGIQLGHFGSFFKESWRANDWMWGRLDGATQLVATVVDSSRIRLLFRDPKLALAALKAVAVTSDDKELKARWDRAEPAIIKELDELYEMDDPDQFPLPATVRALQAAFQLDIAQQELPVVAAAIERSQVEGGAVSSSARRLVADVRHAMDNTDKTIPYKDVARLLSRCDVGRELIREEVGNDLLTATASTAAAVGVTALGGNRSGLALLRPALATVRTAVLAGYLVAQNAVRRSRTAFALTQLLLAFAVGAFAVKMLNGDIGTPLLIVAIPIIVAWVLISALTIGAWWAALILVPSVIIVSWTFLDECDAVEAFGGPDRCPAGAAAGPPAWRQDLARLLPVIVGVIAAVVVWFFGRNWHRARRVAAEPEPAGRLDALFVRTADLARRCLSSPSASQDDDLKLTSEAFVRAVTKVHQPIRRTRGSAIAALVIGAGAFFGVWYLADVLLTRGRHQWLIEKTETLHHWRPAIYLAGIPALLFILTLGRLAAVAPYRVLTSTRPSGVGAVVGRLRRGLRRRIDDARANSAIRWFRWIGRPSLTFQTKKRRNYPGIRAYQGWQAEKKAPLALDPKGTLAPQLTSASGLDRCFDKLQKMGAYPKRVGRALIPRSRRGWWARRRVVTAEAPIASREGDNTAPQ
jgi:patatin-related protein